MKTGDLVMVEHAKRIRAMKTGDLVMVKHARAISIGVLLDETFDGQWLVHWFDDGDWSWELQRDLKVIK